MDINVCNFCDEVFFSKEELIKHLTDKKCSFKKFNEQWHNSDYQNNLIVKQNVLSLKNKIYVMEKQIEYLKQEFQNLLKQNYSSEYENKLLENEKNIIKQFPKDTKCIYYGKINDKSDPDKFLVKFGSSINLHTRVKTHKTTYDTFILLHAFLVPNCIETERIIKIHPLLRNKIRNVYITIKNKLQKFTEVIEYDLDFTLNDIYEIILDIVKESYYSNKLNYLTNIKKITKIDDNESIEFFKNKNINKPYQNSTNSFSIFIENNIIKADNIYHYICKSEMVYMYKEYCKNNNIFREPILNIEEEFDKLLNIAKINSKGKICKTGKTKSIYTYYR